MLKATHSFRGAGSAAAGMAAAAVLLWAVTARAVEPKPPGAAEAATALAQVVDGGAAPVQATLRERALSEAIDAGRIPGEFVTIGDGEASFLARYERARQQRPEGLVLIVPRRGSFVGTDALVAAFTREFPPNGWSVLALQLPLPSATAETGAYDALQEEAVRRVREAFAFAAADGIYPVVVVGEASGAAVAQACLLGSPPPAAAALATLGGWEGSVSGLSVAVLEIIGADDTPAQDHALARALAAGRNPLQTYEQILLTGADAGFLYDGDAVARRLRGWIDRTSGSGALEAGADRTGR